MQGAARLRLAADDARGAAAVQRAAFDRRWRRQDADEIRQMRQRLEHTVGAAT